MDESMIHAQWINEMGIPQLWEKKADGWWIYVTSLDSLEMAKQMLNASARLITITEVQNKGKVGEFQLAYHWDLYGQIYSWIASVAEKNIASICDVCPGADWAEREINDYFAIKFSGRLEHEPLMLRVKNLAGVFLSKERNI